MNRKDVKGLHYITPIKNVPSIMKLGILSNKLSKKVRHISVASLGVQERRDKIRVPGGLWLHDYANLYICARNPMLFRKVREESRVCVLRVCPSILDREGVVVSDMNAARDFARFSPPYEGLAVLNKDDVFAEFWTDPDPTEQYRKTGVKCAEVLVPNKIPPNYIIGAYVSCEKDKETLLLTGVQFSVIIDKYMFFQSRRLR